MALPRFTVVLAICLCGCSSPERPPNIILLFSDDAGYADFGFQGSDEIRTPHLDQLAASGVRFTNGYVTASVCAPSRAGLLTGRYQQRFGFEYNLPGMADEAVPDSARGLPLSETTMAEVLRDRGYSTGMIGKWHLGMADHFHPLNRGFDEFFGMRAGSSGYEPGKARAIENGFSPVDPESLAYLTDEFGNRGADFIRRHGSEPFFLYLSFNAPHTPMQAREDHLAEAKPRFETQVRAKNAAMTRSMDESVGLVLEAVHELGLEENTLVVFVNDNGGAMPYNGSLNAPLRGTKGTALEGGNRVPFVMSWPGTIAPGVYSAPVSTLDLLPTFASAAAAGSTPSDLSALDHDGVDLMPYLADESLAIPHDTLYWKLNWGSAVRAGNWKLVRTPADEVWLFNLAEDEGEQNDLAGSRPAVTERLQRSLESWEATLPKPLWVSEDIWRQHSLSRYDQVVVDGFVRK